MIYHMILFLVYWYHAAKKNTKSTYSQYSKIWTIISYQYPHRPHAFSQMAGATKGGG